MSAEKRPAVKVSRINASKLVMIDDKIMHDGEELFLVGKVDNCMINKRYPTKLDVVPSSDLVKELKILDSFLFTQLDSDEFQYTPVIRKFVNFKNRVGEIDPLRQISEVIVYPLIYRYDGRSGCTLDCLAVKYSEKVPRQKIEDRFIVSFD